jgi:two-component system sensor histidine kinase MtrB
MDGAATSSASGTPRTPAPSLEQAWGSGEALAAAASAAPFSTARPLPGVGPAVSAPDILTARPLPGAAPAIPVPDILRRLRKLAGHTAARLRRRLAAAHRVLRARWLRSLQLRVVTATLVMSAVVVTVLGFFLMQQIASDQLRAKERQAGAVVQSGQIIAETQPGVDSRPNGSPTRTVMRSIVERLEATGPESDYAIAILDPGYAGSVYSGGQTAGVVPEQIPQRLTTAVSRLQRNAQSPVIFTSAYNGLAHPVAGLFYGTPVGPYYQLYYFFPLTQVQQTLTLIQRTLLVAGLALVFLFAAIAALVTRWVVSPVRQAAVSAQRLSTGNLSERMPVRGADELAALARSFNEMATSLQDKMNALEDLSQVQRLFVSDVSHELRTPLTTIRMAADMLFASREQFDSPVAHSAELLQSQLERFEALLIDLLEISRYDANVAVLDPEPVDICNLARNAADEAQQLAERRGAKIEFRLPAEPCLADVDRCRVERILRNLLVNAVEHGEGKDAVVTVAGDSVAVAVAVQDYGIGLRPGEDRRVFERFWRADPARARTTGGTGLGLAIALEDARIHGGWLEAWGERGRGSVFRLTLPRSVGAELAGSPLPLVPDEAEIADTAAAAGLADGHGRVALPSGMPVLRLTDGSGSICMAGDSGLGIGAGLTGSIAGTGAAAGGAEADSQDGLDR